MSVSLEAENEVICGAYPNMRNVYPHAALVLCDMGDDNKCRTILAKLSPHDARVLAQSLADAAERIEPAWDEWLLQTQGGYDDAG